MPLSLVAPNIYPLYLFVSLKNTLSVPPTEPLSKDKYPSAKDLPFAPLSFVVITVRGDETFNFTKSVNSAGEVTYYGDKKGSVTAEATDSAYQDIYGQGMGTSDISRLMNAILPDENLPEDAPHYQKIGSGWLPDGKNYIDYRGDFPGSIEVIRYYFDQYALVKIASGIYTLNENGEVTDGRRCIVKITKFVPVADEAYLKLPEGLKDNTKRKKEGKK